MKFGLTLAVQKATVDVKDDQGRTPLLLAASTGHTGCVTALLDEPAVSIMSILMSHDPRT